MLRSVTTDDHSDAGPAAVDRPTRVIMLLLGGAVGTAFGVVVNDNAYRGLAALVILAMGLAAMKSAEALPPLAPLIWHMWGGLVGVSWAVFGPSGWGVPFAAVLIAIAVLVTAKPRSSPILSGGAAITSGGTVVVGGIGVAIGGDVLPGAVTIGLGLLTAGAGIAVRRGHDVLPGGSRGRA